MVAPPSPQPRRITRPRWLDLRLVLGVLLVLVAVLVGAVVVSRASRTHAVLSATRELAAGTVVRPEDVRLVQAKLPDRGRGVYLSSPQQAVGKVLARGVARGELLPRGALTTVGPHTTLTVSFAAGAAPQLRSGERIEVWLSTATCAPVVLLPDVTVQSVQAGSASLGAGAGQNVVINVAPDQAARVVAALAIDDVSIRAGVLGGGAAASAPSSVPSPSRPAATGGLPADLAACAGPSPSR